MWVSAASHRNWQVWQLRISLCICADLDRWTQFVGADRRAWGFWHRCGIRLLGRNTWHTPWPRMYRAIYRGASVEECQLGYYEWCKETSGVRLFQARFSKSYEPTQLIQVNMIKFASMQRIRIFSATCIHTHRTLQHNGFYSHIPLHWTKCFHDDLSKLFALSETAEAFNQIVDL